MSDESVLARIAAGDSDAVRACMDQYGGLVWSIARRFTHSPAEAEDAVQEVFVDLWKSAARFDPSLGSETTFVAVVARRRLIDLARRSERRPRLAVMPEDFDVPDAGGQSIETSTDAALAARALERIRPDQRRVLLMSIYHGMTHAEIVERTGMPLGTVKSHIRRGLAEVRRILGESEPDPESPVP